MKAQIRDLITRYELSTFWNTLNSFDLQNSLILKLIEIFIFVNIDSSIYILFNNNTAIFNLVIIARFFNNVYTVFFDDLLVSNIDDMRIFDRVAAHYALTKINEREMLHLHELIWLMKNIEFSIIRDRVKSDSNFTIKMIQYLKIVIKQNLMKDLSKLTIFFYHRLW